LRRHHADAARCSEASCESRDNPLFFLSSGGADGTRSGGRQYAIDNHFSDAHAALLDRRDPVLGLGQRQRLCKGDPLEHRPLVIAQRVNHPLCLAGERCNEMVRGFRSPHAGETVAHDSVLLLQIVEHMRNRDYSVGRRQQPQRVACRCRVDDNDVVMKRGSGRRR
jgi:hypothetical protein